MASLPRISRDVAVSPWHVLPLGLSAALIWLLAQRLGQMDLHAVPDALARIGLPALALAGAATWASFRTMGAFEAAIHGLIGTGVSPGRAARAGRRAVAVAQLAGFGAITGALARWRTLPELGAKAVVQVSALASAVFLLGLLPLSAGALLLFLPEGTPLPGLIAAALAAVAAFVSLPLAQRRLRLAQDLSHGRLLLLASWILADVVCAATVFWACLPSGPESAFAPVLAAFVVALTAGLLTNAPGGIGAFELALLALLPAVPVPELLAAILAYRVIYQGLPAIFALPGLLKSPEAPPDLRPALSARTQQALARPACPEWGLLRQHARLWVTSSGVTACLGQAPGHLVAIGRQAGHLCLTDFAAAARDHGRLPVLYKCSRQVAARAQAAGWCVMRIARDAIIDTQTWSATGPRHRQLRRKLRQAQAAGIVISAAEAPLPLKQMDSVAKSWAAVHGGERGFSCGTFAPDLVQSQRVFLARQDGVLIAFVTCNQSASGWSLDLMRHLPNPPPGVMHALVVAAIGAARAAGAPQLSLAAVPDIAPRHQWLAARLPRGLEQFKSSFVPAWRPLYVAAPGPGRLALGLAAIASEIRLGHRVRTWATTRRALAKAH